MTSNALYNIVDRIFIGHGVGEIAIGGVYVVMPLMFIAGAFVGLFAVGGNMLMSIALGEKRIDEANAYFNTTLVLVLAMGIALTVIPFFFFEPLLSLFGTTPENAVYAEEYFRMILLGNIFTSLLVGKNNFIRGTGDTKFAMYTVFLGVVLNILLDPIFIYGFHMGVEGAAIATVLSNAAGAIWVMLYFLRGHSVLKYAWSSVDLRMQRMLEIAGSGFAIFSMQIANSLVLSLINYRIRQYGGSPALSVAGVLSSMSTVIFMPIIGINQGVQPILGYNYGAGKVHRLKQAYRAAAAHATMITAAGFCLMIFFPGFLARIFLPSDASQETLRIFYGAIWRQNLGIPLLGIAMTGSMFFQAIRRPNIATMTSLLRQIIVFVPAIFLLSSWWGLDGVWYSYTVSDTLSALIVGGFLRREFRLLSVPPGDCSRPELRV